MKKAFKIIGISALSLVALCIVAIIVIKLFFKDEVIASLTKQRKKYYVEVLRDAKYALDTVTVTERYCMDDENLAKVKGHFRLDTLFDGTEDTYAKALKIQRFVSDRLPHGNPPEMPEQLNAIELWAFADSTGYQLNCRHHSIVMRDLLMSVGIKARYITCMPQDEEDRDCHVVNEIFSPELDKWIMIDSDQDIVLTDMTGMPLSIRELRDKLIAGEPYLINGQSSEGHFYDMYMAKNSYWYSKHELGCMDTETDGLLPGDRRISLIPVGFKVESGSTRWVFDNTVHTTDPDEFWK